MATNRSSDREAESRNILRNSLDRIPADLQDNFLSVLEWAEQTQQTSDILVDCWAKETDAKIQEVMFLEQQIKVLLQAIRATKDAEAIAALRATAKETVERIRERKRQAELRRLAATTR